MSSIWAGKTGVAVTRFCGSADDKRSVSRVRFDILLDSNHSYVRQYENMLHDLTLDQAIELSMLLIKATHDYRGEHD